MKLNPPHFSSGSDDMPHKKPIFTFNHSHQPVALELITRRRIFMYVRTLCIKRQRALAPRAFDRWKNKSIV
jgi:hypothetical protein